MLLAMLVLVGIISIKKGREKEGKAQGQKVLLRLVVLVRHSNVLGPAGLSTHKYGDSSSPAFLFLGNILFYITISST